MSSGQELRKVKTAVVGCGKISDIYIRNLQKLFDIIDLTTISNRTMDAAKKKAEQFGIENVMTIDEVASSKDIELVVNLTPTPAHFGVIKKMLEAGKHVYTEKMLTATLDEANELYEIAKKNNVMLSVAPDTVLGAGIQSARFYIDSGLIGDITSGFVSVNRNQNLCAEIFTFLQGEGGAVPYDVGIYYIGALIALLGSIKKVTGFAAPSLEHERELLFCAPDRAPYTIPGNNVMAASLEFECGALVSLHFNGNTAGQEKSRFEIVGTEGNLELGDPNVFGGKVTLRLPENEPCELPLTHGFDGTIKLGEPQPFDGYGHRGVGVADLAYAIREERKNRLDISYGIHCMEVLQGIDESASQGKAIEIKSRAEVQPLRRGFYSTMFNGAIRGDAERSLMTK